MKSSGKIFFFLLIFSLSSASVAEAEFGRLYTTPAQRLKLDELRNKQPTEGVVIDLVQEDIQDTTVQEATPVLTDGITLNGLVYRSDGKNTAWINRNSTNAGSIETQFTTVRERDVRSNQVQITLPDNRTSIQLKVGQQYDVQSQQVYDVVNDPHSTSPAISPGDNRPSR
jgi:ABC-type uncharacterized transport system permease subunit